MYVLNKIESHYLNTYIIMYIADINCRICHYLDISSIRSYKSASTDLNHMLKDILAAEEHVQTTKCNYTAVTVTYKQYKYINTAEFDPITLSFIIDYNIIPRNKREYICDIMQYGDWKMISYTILYTYPAGIGSGESNVSKITSYFVNCSGMGKYIISTYGDTHITRYDDIIVYELSTYTQLDQLIAVYMCGFTCVGHHFCTRADIRDKIYNMIDKCADTPKILQYCAEIILKDYQ
jgi:hypothetical protein